MLKTIKAKYKQGIFEPLEELNLADGAEVSLTIGMSDEVPRTLQERVNNITKEQIAEFCRRNHIKKLAFYGSVLRDDFRPDSDVDVLVEFEPGAHIGYITMAGMEIELSEMIGRKVDLRTPNELNAYFKDEVLSEAEVQYEAR